MMHPKKELSDKIRELFRLNAGEFNPTTHLPVAEFIVDKLGEENPHFIQLADIFTYKRNSTKVIDHSSDPVGDYVVRFIGRLDGAGIWGLYPKLEITTWKSEVFGNREDETENRSIIYDQKKVIGVQKFLEIPKVVYLGNVSFNWPNQKELWRYKVKS